jgi:TrmH family RNA methyltransferase
MSAGQRQQYNRCLLTEAQRDRLEVVLVSPRNPLNMGAAARAMANFGFAHLAVVAPFAAHWREARSAVGAPDLLHAAKETETLAEAIAPCTLVVGTGTLTYRKPEQPVVPLPLLAPLIQQELQRGGHVALVFGPEKHGLTREDLSYCHWLVEIPTDTRQPSMNLGQAVAVALYELVRQAVEEKSASAATAQNALETAPNSTSGVLDRLAEVIEETMKAAGYSPRIMQAANRHDLRLLLRRLRWTDADAKHALGLFRRVLWRLAHPDR